MSSKIIVITGASAGIGAEIVRVLSDEGHTVIGFARRAELIDAIANEKQGRKVHSIKVDVTNEQNVVEAFEWVKQKFGKIDVMINNAGTAKNNTFKDADINVWRSIYELNVLAVVLCTREALKLISDDGHIINVSSVLGTVEVSAPGFCLYSSTKHAVRILTRGLRAELVTEKPALKVTLLNPGLTETDMTAGAIAAFPEHALHISANDVAKAASYVISTAPFVDVTEISIQHSGEYADKLANKISHVMK